MKSQRKQKVVDSKFQFKMSLRAVILPLVTIAIVSTILLYYAVSNNNYINEIVKTQDDMIEMFLTTPALYNSDNPVIRNGEKTFKNNITYLVKIKRNSQIVLYSLIAMMVVQSVIIFTLFIFITHRISGPVYVMTRYLQEIRKGKIPQFRPLRKKDEMQDFYRELSMTINHLTGDKGAK